MIFKQCGLPVEGLKRQLIQAFGFGCHLDSKQVDASSGVMPTLARLQGRF